jgi:hypothetical protein
MTIGGVAAGEKASRASSLRVAERLIPHAGIYYKDGMFVAKP